MKMCHVTVVATVAVTRFAIVNGRTSRRVEFGDHSNTSGSADSAAAWGGLLSQQDDR